MNQLIKPSRLIFALGMIGLGFLCFIYKDFIVGRPTKLPVGPIIAYLSGTALILACIAIIINKNGGMAALIVALLILIFSVCRSLLYFTNDWLNGCKAMALLGGALIIASSFFDENDSLMGNIIVNKGKRKNLVLIGSILLAAFFIAGGYAHFKFADFVIGFIPAYIPFHAFWTYFCGICLIAGGIGLFIPKTRKWAAFLSGVMILGWFLLLHIPRFIATPNDPSDRMGLCESFTFAGIFFVLAGIFSERE